MKTAMCATTLALLSCCASGTAQPEQSGAIWSAVPPDDADEAAADGADENERPRADPPTDEPATDPDAGARLPSEDDASAPATGVGEAPPDEPHEPPPDDPDEPLVCEAGLADCDGDGSTCETAITTSPLHCGQCRNACPDLPGGPRCVDGGCVFALELPLVDTYVNGSATRASYGDEERVLIDLSPERYETLVAPVDASILVGKDVLSAVLTLTVCNQGDDGTLHALQEAFDEDVSWTTRPAFGPELERFDGGLSTVELDVRDIVQGWADGARAFGFGLRSTGTNGVDFWSVDHDDTSTRPTLSVEYR